MVQIVSGDILKSKMQTLVNPVNCCGVMGNGLALKFRRKFPNMFLDYRKKCHASRVKLGEPYLYRDASGINIINFPTKQGFKDAADVDGIAHGLDFLLDHYSEWEITEMAIPALGTGNGGLKFSEFGPFLYNRLLQFDILVEFYLPEDWSVLQFRKLIGA